MKIWGYIWKIIVNLITLFVIVSIFSIASTNFETAVLAILILIYLSIMSFSASWGFVQMQLGEALDKELSNIKKLIINPKRNLEMEAMAEVRNSLGLSDSIDSIFSEIPQKTEEEKEAEKERVEKKNTIMVKFYINIGFQFIFYIFALYKLISVFN